MIFICIQGIYQWRRSLALSTGQFHVSFTEHATWISRWRLLIRIIRQRNTVEGGGR
jgi:hypothetical protein